MCGLASVQAGLWEQAQEYLRKVNRDIGQMITRSRAIGRWWSPLRAAPPPGGVDLLQTVLSLSSTDQAFLQFFGDEFLRLLLIRFVFCSATLRLHKVFRVRPYFCLHDPDV